MADKLTYKQEMAAQAHVLKGLNYSDSYREAYDTANMSDVTINNEASILFNTPKISARVEELKELQLKRAEVTIDRVVKEYASLAFFDPRKFFYPDGSLRPLDELDKDDAAALAGLEIIETTIESDGIGDTTNRLKKIKLADKKAALDSLAKFLEMFVTKTKVEHTGKDGEPLMPPSMTKEQLQKMAAERGLPVELFDK